MEVAQVLREAAALIEERGWAQHTGVDDSGAVCLDTALHEAMRGSHTLELCDAVRVRFARTVGSPLDLTQWNDDHRRTRQEVLDALDRAASETV